MKQLKTKNNVKSKLEPFQAGYPSSDCWNSSKDVGEEEIAFSTLSANYSYLQSSDL